MEPPRHSPDRKRALRSTASLPSTAETYAALHGLPDDHAARMREVGMRARQNLARGHQRPFTTTASSPALDFSSSSIALPDSGTGAGYVSAAEIARHARGVLDISALRRREVQPYGSVASGASGASGVSGTSLGSGYTAVDDNGLPALSAAGGRNKRREYADEADGDATDTEDDNGAARGVASGTFGAAVPAAAVDHAFPPVFTSPALTEPELFAAPAPPLPQPGAAAGRQMRALPARRALGKTVSMPVSGPYGGLGAMGMGMDVDDGGEEDGFDVSEWAKSEDF